MTQKESKENNNKKVPVQNKVTEQKVTQTQPSKNMTLDQKFQQINLLNTVNKPKFINDIN